MKCETALIVITAIIVAAGGIMAALIGFVLPKSLLQNEADDESPYTSSTKYVCKWIRERNAERIYKSIKDYKWLVSINLPLYQDLNYHVYACSGVIIAEDEVLTGTGCIKNAKRYQMQDFFKAIVRSSSDYYSYGGTIHSVKEFSYPYPDEVNYKQLVRLKVSPKFSKDKIIKVANTLERATMEAVGWGGMRVSTMYVFLFY